MESECGEQSEHWAAPARNERVGGEGGKSDLPTLERREERLEGRELARNSACLRRKGSELDDRRALRRFFGVEDPQQTAERADDKVYCVYIAPNKEMVQEHAKQGGFPANRISEVKSVIDPTTAER